MRAFELSQSPSPPRDWKSSNVLILEFSGREKLEMRAFEDSQRPSPSSSLEKFKRADFKIFGSNSSKCGRLNFPSAQALPQTWKSSNALILRFSGREKLEMRAFEFLPCPIPSPSLEKCKRVLFLWSFRSFRLGQRCVPCRVVSLQPMLRVVVFRFGHSYVSLRFVSMLFDSRFPFRFAATL